jgi:hypothetical protein
MARGQCKQAQEQRTATAAQIEQLKKQSSQNDTELKNIEHMIPNFRQTRKCGLVKRNNAKENRPMRRLNFGWNKRR